MLQFPKTATAFLDSVIVGKMPLAEKHLYPGRWGKHNYRSEIPRWWEGLPVVGVRRNVFDLWASWYFAGVVAVGFPNVSFEDYYRRVNDNGGRIRYGEQCKGSGGFMRKYHNLMFASKDGGVDDVRFLDFANLNQELYNLLAEYGYDDSEILTKQPIGVGRNRNGRPWQDIISSDLAGVIVKDEKQNKE